MTTECKCGRPTRDNAYVCDHHGDELARALGEIPWLDDELQTTTARQAGVDYRKLGGGKGGKKPAEMPSPANMAASEARGHLKSLLVSWALFCASEGIRSADPRQELPADDLPALSRWLLWRVDGLTLHEIGYDAVDEITNTVAQCHRIIDRPADKQYLGPCDQCDHDGGLYATPGGTWATCNQCQAVTDAEALRAGLLRELDDRLCTAAEIARLSTFLGLKADREQVRKRINQWARRGLLDGHGDDDPRFRFGVVYERLLRSEYAPGGIDRAS